MFSGITICPLEDIRVVASALIGISLLVLLVRLYQNKGKVSIVSRHPGIQALLLIFKSLAKSD
jgi:hypothetical protein